jgi:hypothetical protein
MSMTKDGSRKVSLNRVRQALRMKFGWGGYRITGEGQVHYYTPGKGWLFLGWLSEIERAVEQDTFRCIFTACTAEVVQSGRGVR